MENALLIGLSRQMALGRELDVIANNMANVSTNGFKARQSRFREHLTAGASADAFARPDRKMSFVAEAGTALDLAAGAVERTGNPLDAAIKGDGFFVVRTPAGERYTRNGAFSLDRQGQLVTSDGFAVMGENGPIAFSPQETGLAIGNDGTISTSQGERGKLRLVRFADPQTLQSEGSNLFSATVPAQGAGPTAQVEAGAIERSNVKPVIEMTRLLDVNRAYTTLSSLMGRMDELRRTSLSRLADTNA